MKSLEVKTFDKKERLCIYEDQYEDEAPYISILYVPNLNEHDHFHVYMSLGQAKKLRKFLNDYFEEK